MTLDALNCFYGALIKGHKSIVHEVNLGSIFQFEWLLNRTQSNAP